MANDLGACDTEVLILSAAATEQWKLLSDDFLVFDYNMPVVSGYEQARSVKEKIRLVELGDNLAEEGAATH
jgi:CheY-like chemotaxis protein